MKENHALSCKFLTTSLSRDRETGSLLVGKKKGKDGHLCSIFFFRDPTAYDEKNVGETQTC